MTLREVGKVGWFLVAATSAAAGSMLLLALAVPFDRPPWDAVFAGLALATPLLALAMVWYLFDVAWAREIRVRKEAENQEIHTMGTAEVLLRLLDRSTSHLDRLTKYMGWFFVLVLAVLIFMPLLYSFALVGVGLGGPLVLAVPGAEMVLWLAYFYYYYKIKHENDLWKERIRWLRERERSLLER